MQDICKIPLAMALNLRTNKIQKKILYKKSEISGNDSSEGLLCRHGCVRVPSLLQVPSLIVYGDLDTQLGELSLSNLSKLANHSVVVMKGAGHPCYLDDPDTWHKALTDFLITM